MKGCRLGKGFFTTQRGNFDLVRSRRACVDAFLQNAELAWSASTSHMRTYATYSSNEKHMFHVRHFHSFTFLLKHPPCVNPRRWEG
ncbi:hypothetical protein BDR04DRAFT_1036739 [Suillus decipiens]|nr:hypothetical protein BDR04DRAFT_1036739 [Suillus decipiens]